MTHLIIPALVALLVSGLAGSSYAKDGERLPNFKQLCITDGSTGFNWVNGGWKRTNFKTYKIVISKITPPRNPEEARNSKEKYGFMVYYECRKQMNENETGDGEFRKFNACLKVQRLGEEHPDIKGCSEFHSKFNEMKNWKTQITCEGLNFTPNGHFHKANIHDQLEAKPKNDYKDTLSISVGKCADISN